MCAMERPTNGRNWIKHSIWTAFCGRDEMLPPRPHLTTSNSPICPSKVVNHLILTLIWATHTKNGANLSSWFGCEISALCSVSSPMLAPTLTSINLESNNIEFITRDPFQYCWNLTDLSLAINRINRLTSGTSIERSALKSRVRWNIHNLPPSTIYAGSLRHRKTHYNWARMECTKKIASLADLFESMHSLRRLNLSHNALLEFDGSTLSQCKQLIELDLSHNQITTLKVNEVYAHDMILICWLLLRTLSSGLMAVLWRSFYHWFTFPDTERIAEHRKHKCCQ